MKNKRKKEGLVKYKLLYTFILLIVYIVGKCIPLYMVDYSSYMGNVIDTEALLMQSISGDLYQCSIFALGITPIMIATMLVQLVIALRKSDARMKISPKKQEKVTLMFIFVFAVILAIFRAEELSYKVDGIHLLSSQIVSIIEMVAGVMIIKWLITRNKRYGLGGQTVFIFINILDGIISCISGQSLNSLVIPLLISLVLIVIVIIMENSEYRIPLQRISIHNIYADKNYMAIKLNPVGIMPAMFATAAFILPQLLVQLLTWIFPENYIVFWWHENMSLSKPAGICVYILLLYLISFIIARLFINPKDITEQYLKSGDSIENIHAGKDTKKYLSKVITLVTLFSSTVLSICIVVPMIMQMYGIGNSALSSLPTSIMILTGMWCNIYREIIAVQNLEAYEPFI